MRDGYNLDRSFGASDIGGLVFATVQCPIFDPREGVGNFQWEPEGAASNIIAGKNIELNRAAIEKLDPFADLGFVRVINPLALPYYEISQQYRMDETAFKTFNWLKLLELGEDILQSERSIAGFIKRVTVRVRLAASVELGWDKNAQTYIMQVTSPAFGQVIQDESIGFPILPPSHNKDSREQVALVFKEIDNKNPEFETRAKPRTRE